MGEGGGEEREGEFTIHPVAPERRIDTRPHISVSLSMSASLGLVHLHLSPGATAPDLRRYFEADGA